MVPEELVLRADFITHPDVATPPLATTESREMDRRNRGPTVPASLAMGVAMLALAWPAAAQEVTLHGPAGQTRVLTAADIAAMPHQSAMLAPEGGGAPRRFEGPALSDLVQSVGAPPRPLRGPSLADIVVVRGADGYRVAFSLADLDPATRRETIILADKVDGGPLPEKEAPFRLVVKGDLRPARSVRMVASVTVEAAP